MDQVIQNCIGIISDNYLGKAIALKSKYLPLTSACELKTHSGFEVLFGCIGVLGYGGREWETITYSSRWVSAKCLLSENCSLCFFFRTIKEWL